MTGTPQIVPFEADHLDASAAQALGACLTFSLEADLAIPERNLKLTAAGSVAWANGQG
jgi:hypothetical protein